MLEETSTAGVLILIILMGSTIPNVSKERATSVFTL